jgi:hypothetical protein
VRPACCTIANRSGFKVRCDGSQPCHNCAQAALSCTFNKPPQKKGPKGSRAKVISELRKSQELSGIATFLKDGTFYQSPFSSPRSGQPDPLTPALIEACINFFFENMHGTMPILDRSEMMARAHEIQVSVESYCLIGSLCAFMLIQPGAHAPYMVPGAQKSQQIAQNNAFGLRIVEDVSRLRNATDYKSDPNPAAMVTSFFISVCYIGLERHTSAWYHLQEAILIARVLRLHNEATYKKHDLQATLNRRAFWLLFLSER